MAIALQTGRAKDHARLVMFVEAGIADLDRLRDILARNQSEGSEPRSETCADCLLRGRFERKSRA